MTDELFFSLDNVRSVRHISINIDDFDLYAQEVQRNFVQKLLGVNLYLALIDDLVAGVAQTQRFIDLLNGERYQVGNEEYVQRGIVLYSSYLWLYNYTMDSDAQITPVGVQLFKDEAAEKMSKTQIQAHYIRSAEGIEDQIIHFLQNNNDIYPEFSYWKNEEPAEDNNFSFKVVGKTWEPPNEYTDV